MSERAVTGIRDGVEAILDPWHGERPDLPVSPLGGVTRPARVRARIRVRIETASAAVFDGCDLTPADFPTPAHPVQRRGRRAPATSEEAA